jgi:hypothetical protein
LFNVQTSQSFSSLHRDGPDKGSYAYRIHGLEGPMISRYSKIASPMLALAMLTQTYTMFLPAGGELRQRFDRF